VSASGIAQVPTISTSTSAVGPGQASAVTPAARNRMPRAIKDVLSDLNMTAFPSSGFAARCAVATYLAGKLIYLLRDIVLLMLVAGFTAMLLNPAVAKVQRRIPRRGLAVTIVTLWAALVFNRHAQHLDGEPVDVGEPAPVAGKADRTPALSGPPRGYPWPP
jgi:hypothetical protein